MEVIERVLEIHQGQNPLLRGLKDLSDNLIDIYLNNMNKLIILYYYNQKSSIKNSERKELSSNY